MHAHLAAMSAQSSHRIQAELLRVVSAAQEKVAVTCQELLVTLQQERQNFLQIAQAKTPE